MFIYGLVYWALSAFLVLYTLRKYFLLHRNLYLFILLIQIVSNLTQILSIAFKTEIDWYMQAYFIICSFIVPIVVLTADFFRTDIEELVNIRYGDRYAKKADYINAINRYKNAISRNPKNAETYAKIGRMYKANGDRRTAFDRFAKAIDLNKEDYKSYYEIGLIFIEMGKNADAQIVLDNALRIKPDFTPASEVLAKVFVSESKYEDACNIYKEALKYDEDNYDIYYNMGLAKLELNNIDDAEMCYKRAIDINPTLYKAYFGLGQISLLKNDLNKAESMFKKSLQDSDVMAKAYYQIAKIRMLKKDEENAITFLGYAFDTDSTYRSYAEEEPIFAKLKNFINEIGLDTEASKRLAKAEALSNSNEAIQSDIDEKETVLQSDSQEDIPEQSYNLTDNLVDDLHYDNYEKEDAVDSLKEEDIESNHTEEELLRHDADVEEFDENEYIDEEPDDGFFGFFKKLFNKKNDNEFESDDEDDDPLYPSKNRFKEVETNNDSQETNYNVRKVDDSSNKEIKKAFEKEFTEDDLDIFEKFKKLKDEEDKKAEKYKALEEQEIVRKQELEEESRINENRKNRVRYLSKDEEEKDEYDTPRVREVIDNTYDSGNRKSKGSFQKSMKKRSFDFDTAEINEDLAINVDDISNDDSAKYANYDENNNLDNHVDIQKQEESKIDDELDTGFNYLKRYNR